MGVEMEFYYAPWPREEIEALENEGWFLEGTGLDEVAQINAYWKGRSLVSRIGLSLDDERLWPFMQTGMVLAAWKSKSEGSGGGYAESGMGLGPGFYLSCADFEKVLQRGLLASIEEARSELKGLRQLGPASVEKHQFLQAMIIALEAIVHFAGRFSRLARDLAAAETDPVRKDELIQIAQTCSRVPAHPAGSFREALQSLWFAFLMTNPSPTAALGRMDQYLHPFYLKDVREGRISEEDVLELLQCLRIKDMELNRISGKANRQKNSGMAKWHNCTIGGQTADGSDATNEMTYLILEAARLCPTPHHTITLRVHEGTPQALMVKALELVRTGIGMPAFVGDPSYLAFLEGQGVPREQARDYVMCGCLDVGLPGDSRVASCPMFVTSMVLDLALNDGIDPRTGQRIGPPTGDPATFTRFEQLMSAFKTQLSHTLECCAEYNNIFIRATAELFPDPVRTAMMANPVSVGRNLLDRNYTLENGAVLNSVGMVNVADSLTAAKKLVFDERRFTMGELKAALIANWDGHKEIRQACLKAPKYGNDDPYADAVAAELYQYFAETTAAFPTVLGGAHKPTAISISSQWPGGAQTCATPDGRYAGECLADGALSAMRGRDVTGPTALLKSASHVDQAPFQATLLNMKFHPSGLATEEDLKKLSFLIRTYFALGGKHLQFNVVGKETLQAARDEPGNYGDLVVRVAGYSAYYVKLTPPMQDEILARTELTGP